MLSSLIKQFGCLYFFNLCTSIMRVGKSSSSSKEVGISGVLHESMRLIQCSYFLTISFCIHHVFFCLKNLLLLIDFRFSIFFMFLPSQGRERGVNPWILDHSCENKSFTNYWDKINWCLPTLSSQGSTEKSKRRHGRGYVTINRMENGGSGELMNIQQEYSRDYFLLILQTFQYFWVLKHSYNLPFWLLIIYFNHAICTLHFTLCHVVNTLLDNLKKEIVFSPIKSCQFR